MEEKNPNLDTFTGYSSPIQILYTKSVGRIIWAPLSLPPPPSMLPPSMAAIIESINTPKPKGIQFIWSARKLMNPSKENQVMLVR